MILFFNLLLTFSSFFDVKSTFIGVLTPGGSKVFNGILDITEEIQPNFASQNKIQLREGNFNITSLKGLGDLPKFRILKLTPFGEDAREKDSQDQRNDIFENSLSFLPIISNGDLIADKQVEKNLQFKELPANEGKLRNGYNALNHGSNNSNIIHSIEDDTNKNETQNFLSITKEGDIEHSNTSRDKQSRFIDNITSKLQIYVTLLKELLNKIFNNKFILFSIILLIIMIIAVIIFSMYKRREQKKKFERAFFSAIENLK